MVKLDTARVARDFCASILLGHYRDRETQREGRERDREIERGRGERGEREIEGGRGVGGGRVISCGG